MAKNSKKTGVTFYTVTLEGDDIDFGSHRFMTRPEAREYIRRLMLGLKAVVTREGNVTRVYHPEHGLTLLITRERVQY